MSIWDEYPNIKPDKLRILVALAAEELLESGVSDPELPPDLLQISPVAASRQLLPLIQKTEPSADRGEIQNLLEDEELSIQVVMKILDEVSKYSEIANRIAKRYEDSTKKMAIPELLLLSSALVILAIKLKEIRWGDKEKKISFYESNMAVKSFLIGLLKGSE